MKQLSKIIFVTLFLCVIVLPTQVFSQASISLDHVDGLINGKVQPDIPVKLHLRWTNNTGLVIKGQAIGFRVFLSNNGELENGTFEPPYFDDLLSEIPDMFDLIFATNRFSVDGVGSDTLSIGGIAIGSGLPDGYDKIIVNITTSVFSEQAGDSLCLDSSYYPSSGNWLWSSGTDIFPDWSGPHCYEILPSCCVDLRGNFNNSSNDSIDISDLVGLVLYMFAMGNLPLCEEEADFNGDGNLDISDLVALIAYMHLGGAPPASCP